MPLRLAFALAIALASSAAHADANAKAKAAVTQAFTDFITSLATDQPALSGLEAFLPPFLVSNALPDAADVKRLLDAPRLVVLRVGLSRSGTSAWIAAEIKTTGVTIFDDTTRNVTLRASGFLVLDRGTWRVRAADLSRAIRDKVAAPGCGNASHQWSLAGAPPKQLVAPVREVLAAFNRGTAHAAHVSDDRAVLVLGSAPGEQYGGAAAKKSVKRWDISSTVFGNENDDDLRALAGVGPDAEMMWIAAPIMAPAKFCAEYRGFFVVAKEATGWKLVHEHFSTPM